MARIQFTQAARKHRVAAGRARAVLGAPVAIVPVYRSEDTRVMQLYLGDDDTGRALEVGVIDTDEGDQLVIHVMDLREKFRPYYDTGKAGTP